MIAQSSSIRAVASIRMHDEETADHARPTPEERASIFGREVLTPYVL